MAGVVPLTAISVIYSVTSGVLIAFAAARSAAFPTVPPNVAALFQSLRYISKRLQDIKDRRRSTASFNGEVPAHDRRCAGPNRL